MKLQPPKGTRDFYPDEMAKRRYLHDAWRRVSQRHGFDEVDGPIFESLDLYKVKSGDGIVSELFHFKDRGDRELAIRPEFTPTLARMVAAKANGLPKPIKWFCTPNLCRAEKPQRGRLREFDQWNIDMLGLDSLQADAEVIAVACDLLKELGVKPDQVKCKISHREVARAILSSLGVPDDKMNDAFTLLDGKAKMPATMFIDKASEIGMDQEAIRRLNALSSQAYAIDAVDQMLTDAGLDGTLDNAWNSLVELDGLLTGLGLFDWCEFDLSIVRGLAYYTGTVFELHVATGKERALGGGGRYDGLIELFGGPAMSGVGFGMGDVVLSNLLEDLGLPLTDDSLRPDAFVIALNDTSAEKVPSLLSSLREQGFHVRSSYKTTRNIGKLLKEANACRARFAIILEFDDGLVGPGSLVSLKDLATGDQQPITIDQLADHLRK